VRIKNKGPLLAEPGDTLFFCMANEAETTLQPPPKLGWVCDSEAKLW